MSGKQGSPFLANIPHKKIVFLKKRIIFGSIFLFFISYEAVLIPSYNRLSLKSINQKI